MNLKDKMKNNFQNRQNFIKEDVLQQTFLVVVITFFQELKTLK